MVLLTVTPAIQAAVSALQDAHPNGGTNFCEELREKLKQWNRTEPGSSIDHVDLIDISQRLVATSRVINDHESIRRWRLDSLLKGATVYQQAPAPKPEPTSEYKALMRRLRAEEEQRQYERMTNPVAAKDILGQRPPTTAYEFNPATSIGQAVGADEVDEVTYADVNRQVALIINILISIVACSVAIWIAARSWTVPQRLGLSMSGSGLVAVAEVVIYMGYIRRIEEAKSLEKRKVETKEIVQSWVLEGSKSSGTPSSREGVRYRKGKHR